MECLFHLDLVWQNYAKLTDPGGPSVACSTAKAIEWDSQWSNNIDPSGRAAIGVHVSAYDSQVPTSLSAGKGPAKMTNKKPRMVEVTAPSLTIKT